jgi:copper chaperone CopZ
MAGPAVNSASILVIGKVFGKRTLWLYLLSIIIGAILFGLGIDYLLPQDWFAVQAGFANDEHCAHGLSVMDWVWVAALVLLLINAFWQMHRHGHSCECCHDHDHNHEAHEHEAHCHEHQSHEHTAHEHASAEVTRYTISGMSCNHCKANVERAIRGVEGVEDVDVNLATGIATVTGHHDTERVIRQVDDFGYSATIISEN